MFDNLVDSSYNGSDIKAPVKAKRTHVSSNNIPGLQKSERGLDGEKNLLKN